MCAICNFKIDFGVGHPLALSVAVATRKAIEFGMVGPIDASTGARSAARTRISSIEALNLLQASIEGAHSEDALLALPDFYVLPIENDTWGFFRATTVGFDPDIVPEMPDLATTDETRRSNIVITSEAGLRAWMDGRFTIETAFQQELVGPDAPEHSMRSLTQMFVVSDPAVVGA